MSLKFIKNKSYLFFTVIILLQGIALTIFVTQDRKNLETHAASSFVKTRVADGASSLTAMEFAPDGRLFFLEKAGKVRVVKDGSLLPTPFLTLPVATDGERGVIGIAFDPNFASNKYIYIHYTVSSPLHNRISRFTANGDVADPASETPILDLPPLNAAIHNGGAIHFGPDGKLYIGVGDNANGANAQDMATIMGKVLRINADGTIPTDNPFYTTATGNSRAIWATGFRNPYTFGIQPGTGRLFVNDVGDNGDKRWEEVNDVQKGKNYGWPTAWGDLGTGGEKPFYTYQTEGCAVTGGTFYNPGTVTFPSNYVGKYFFTDYCSGWIKTIDPTTKEVALFQNYPVLFPADLKVGPDGALYVLTYSTSYSTDATTTGYIEKIAYTDPANATPSPCAVSPTPTPTPAGATPVGTIVSPANNAIYTAGQTINYSATGTDTEDGTLPDSAFSWTIVFHHATHTHPFLGPINGQKAGTFTIPQQGEWARDVWYRVHLTVTDSSGLKHSSYVDLKPKTTALTLATVPQGLQTSFDSVPDTSPYTQTTVAGLKRTIGTTATQTLNGKTYQFVSWSDGGALSHEITAPTTNTTYTANFTEVATTPTPTGTAAGNGLTGNYYANMTLTGTPVIRVDPKVGFGYGTGGGAGAMHPSMPVDKFSVRWTGFVKPKYSQAYTFATRSDDGVRLWINGQFLVNNWTDHSTTENTGTITLNAGQKYTVTMEFYDNGYDAIAELYWSSPSQPKEIIPQSQLFTN